MRLSSSHGWVPATGGVFNNADALTRPGTTVSTGLYWAEAWGGGIEVNLNINSEDVDEQANLKIGEAIRLTRELVMVIEAVAFEGTLFEDGEVLEEIASTATDVVAFVKARRA
ncbi:hypothetical protein ASD11_04575 [Aeromicrobium sp. Root495]|uniref:hypothetical protein n=1 Tax=Aeromicrobium sp. Root495 TaxID=1736550 RepID=UPI0006FA3CD6|nr:hypothetical protein [Aeromicrobium sp. Root495]KQY58908.1 hypothetical protein ASD11_04575 [Aeromicrobium sp. Root495]